MVHGKGAIVFLCPVHIIYGILNCDPFTIEVDFLLLGVWIDRNTNIVILYSFDIRLVIISFHILIDQILQCNIYQIKVTTVCEQPAITSVGRPSLNPECHALELQFESGVRLLHLDCRWGWMVIFTPPLRNPGTHCVELLSCPQK
jgi:hypothetical protein